MPSPSASGRAPRASSVVPTPWAVRSGTTANDMGFTAMTSASAGDGSSPGSSLSSRMRPVTGTAQPGCP